MTIELRSDIASDQNECNCCHITKPITEFSLQVGKGSDRRKTVCKSCEYARRKSRKAKGVTDEAAATITNSPCSICGNRASNADVVNGRMVGMLCKGCANYQELFLDKGIDFDLFQRAANYAHARICFPILLEWETAANMTPEPQPILDYIDANQGQYGSVGSGQGYHEGTQYPYNGQQPQSFYQ